MQQFYSIVDPHEARASELRYYILNIAPFKYFKLEIFVNLWELFHGLFDIDIQILLPSGWTDLMSASTASGKHSTTVQTVAKSRIQRQAVDNFIFTAFALSTRGF